MQTWITNPKIKISKLNSPQPVRVNFVDWIIGDKKPNSLFPVSLKNVDMRF